MSTAQTELFEYGIQNEDSDIRAHVSVVNRTIYVFPTRNAVKAIAEKCPKEAPAYQNGIKGPTANGWPTPIKWIEDIREVKFHSWSGWNEFSPILSTSKKGQLAVRCVSEALKLGRFPLWIKNAKEIADRTIQRRGTDILLFCQQKIQVKCDYRAGETGNLYLQKAERNPNKAY